MPNPINIFLCHKKVLIHEQDGVETEQENLKASILHAILEMHPDKYDAWIDESQISAGSLWETEIYGRLLVSDVLLVAIGPGTSKSEWVGREIALAKVLGVAIVPLGYDLEQEEFGQELKALHIDDIQGKLTHNIKMPAKDALLQEIDSDLRQARKKTLAKQKSVIAALAARQSRTVPKAADKQKAFSIAARLGASTINLHVASGDFSKTTGIDVLVNSENDWMQMARYFETPTVSSLLRKRGARLAGGKYVDTIQRELDVQLGDRARPVLAAEVFVTSAGGPDSQLAKVNKARYIFHVAAVQAVDAEARVVPFKQPDQIEDCVRSCLSQLLELNRRKGVISPAGTDQRLEQEDRKEKDGGLSRSILFPLFGTGQGGASASEAIKPMIEGVVRFFDDADNTQLAEDMTDVYFAAFKEPDVESVVSALKETFE